MCLKDGEKLSVVEIIKLFITSYKNSGGNMSKPKIGISLFLDNCYGGGQYLDVCNALQKGEIEGSKCLNLIRINAACRHDEISFATSNGGKFSSMCLKKGGMYPGFGYVDSNFYLEWEKKVINGTPVKLNLPKDRFKKHIAMSRVD